MLNLWLKQKKESHMVGFNRFLPLIHVHYGYYFQVCTCLAALFTGK